MQFWGSERIMTTITMSLPDARLVQLRETAARFDFTAEELVRVTIEDLLARPDDAFKRAADHVLGKSPDLYRWSFQTTITSPDLLPIDSYRGANLQISFSPTSQTRV
jgi:hypothetical protein